MSQRTGIEWTDATWNPVTGCTEVSRGCDHCYARTLAHRLLATRYLARAPERGAGETASDPFAVRLWPERLDDPRGWSRSRRVLVNSMSDVFHVDVPEPYIRKMFEVMLATPRHTYQVLTKRPERAAEIASKLLPWPANVWMGTSFENQRWTCRADALRRIPAAIRFLSCEPLLGPLHLDLTGIHWVIVGGESGHGARRMQPQWAECVRAQCEDQGAKFFFKQWGAFNAEGRRVGKHKAGRTLGGRTWDSQPLRQEKVTVTSSPQ